MHSQIKIVAKRDKNKPLLDSILESRGIIDKNEYFDPEKKELMSPFAFSDMEKAVSIIKNAITNKDMILIWGDFDADGVTSTSIIYKALKALGANFTYFIPDRLKLGHGINLKELLLQKSKNNVKVLITVDCGISNLKEIDLIKTMGVKTIVTDHHEPLDTLPNADSIINPLAKNALKESLSVQEIEKISHLAGAGVALKLAFALLGENHNDVKKEILALSAVGTIADVVPLIGENRIIAAKGIQEINNKVHDGINLLFKKQNINKQINSEDISFILAPRINSAGRLDSPFESIKLLIDDNINVLNYITDKLDNLNKIRQSLCETTFNEAIGLLKNPSDSIVLYNPDWHIGIIGIVASKLVERFNLPVFLITLDENKIFRCSIRGIKGYDITKILKSLEGYFLGYGGHSLAGGFSADSNLYSIETLIQKINEAVSNYKDESKIDNSIEVDAELFSSDINFGLFEDLKKMEPFGECNKRPNFLFKDAKIISHKQIGKEQNHLSYSVLKENKEFNCLYWKRSALGFCLQDKIDFVFKPELNEFNGEKKIQLITDLFLNDSFEENFYKKTKFFDHRMKTGIYDKINDYVKNKNGEVKIIANTVSVKKELEKYKYIKENTLEDNLSKQKTIMLFDYPSTKEELSEILKIIKPENIHLMDNRFSRNIDEYISLICGMLKYAHNCKKGQIDINLLAKKSGLNECSIQVLLEILEKIESISIDDIDKITLKKAPSIEAIHNDTMFEIFKDEFDKIIQFKTHIKNAPIEEIEALFNF